jgi:hypothetical protein
MQKMKGSKSQPLGGGGISAILDKVYIVWTSSVCYEFDWFCFDATSRRVISFGIFVVVAPFVAYYPYIR